MIELLHDTDPRFGPVLNRYGCNLFTLLAIPQVHLGRALSADQILALSERAAADPSVMRTDPAKNTYCKMGENEHRPMNWAFRLLGATLVARQVGRIVAGRPEYWPAFRDGRGHHYQKWWWRTDGDDGHFTLADGEGVAELYDPHDPMLLPVDRRHWINKRYVAARYLYRVWEL